MREVFRPLLERGRGCAVYAFRLFTPCSALCLLATLVACGGGGGGGGGVGGGGGGGSPAPTAHYIGGTVSGLTGVGLTLTLNDGNDLTITSNGAFRFSSSLPTGTTYSVAVKKQPTQPRQVCNVVAGTGSVTNDVTTIAVTCEYTEGNLLTSAPLPSYAPGTGELAVFESINAARLGGGFGALIQNSALDMAAAAHAHYLAEHFYESSAMLFDVAALSSFTESDLLAVRAESVGMSGFTGEDPPARALAAGYGSPTVLEGAAFTVGDGDENCADQFLDSVDLRRVVLGVEQQEIGIGITKTADGMGFVCVVMTGHGSVMGEAASDWVGVYPFDGQEDVSIAMASDSTGTALGAVRGQPITVAVDPHEKLVLSTITLRHVASGQMLALRVVQDDDHIVHAVPQTFLAQNAEYSLRIVGNIGELRIDRTASFTTGARSGSAAFAPTSTPRTVRSVLAIPTDRPTPLEYPGLVQHALEHLQAWYQQQLGGRTFALYSASPQICSLPYDSTHYLSDTWNKVYSDLQACAPVLYADPDYDWVVYADVDHGCGLPGRLGAATFSLVMLPRGDLEGLAGRDTAIDECGIDWGARPPSRFIGGAGHELGHSFGLPHPPGCDAADASCDNGSIMWTGLYSYPDAYLSPNEQAALREHRFFWLQRFAR